MARLHEVLLDANFLVLGTEFNIDVISEIHRLVPGARLVTLSPIVKELDKIKGGQAGKLFVRKNKITVIQASGAADKALLDRARTGAVVCTNDRQLRQNLRAEGLPVIFMKGKSVLCMEGVP